ncbi:mRNA-decapping enzyme subunit 2 [Ceratobasidium sp. 423]|nr:mRNA-decapping enzyme subunit 2 [Ceratobasidium sp. 423]
MASETPHTMFAQSSTSTSSDPPFPGLVSGSFSFKDATLEDVWEDLSSRFILNVPDEELETVERICFQVEQAHWFYEDFIRDENPDLPSLPLKKFSQQLFAACPLLRQWSASQEHEQAFQEFMRYKTRVPVCGCIMLNSSLDKCVLVKGWKASSGWGFPKGKINEDEKEHDCAIRETLEETGFDVTSLLDRQIFIKNTLKEQQLTLYIVPDVPEDTVFQTRTRKEISKIEWFKLSDLPTWKKNRLVAANNKFYLISPFVSQLKAFVSERKRQRKAARKSGRTPGISNQEPASYYPGQSHVDELDTASPFRPNARPHERYDADLRMDSRPTNLWDHPEPQHVKPRALAVHVGHDSESSSQNSSGTNALTSGSSAHASAIEPITPSSDTPYGNDVHVQSVETGPSNDSPHLARLLQGLSLSAAAVEPIQQSILDSKPAAVLSQSADQKRSPPTKSIFDFVSPFDALASPAAKPEPIPTPTPPPQSTAKEVGPTNPPASHQAPILSGPILNSQPRATPAPPAAFADLGLVPASLTSKSPVLHKRVGATPQPYNVPNGLPHPAATPVPGDSGDHPMDRRRKQLALLESIAGDADRMMTPAPQTPLMSSRTPAAQFLNYHPLLSGFQPPPPAERMQYPMGVANGASRPGLPPSPLYSRPVPSRMAGPEPNVHKGHLLTMFSSTPTPAPMPPPPGSYPQAMYHNNIPQPHPQFGPSPTLAPIPGPGHYGTPNYPMQPQYAPPMNGGFPPGPPGPNGNMYPAPGYPYSTPGLS